MTADRQSRGQPGPWQREFRFLIWALMAVPAVGLAGLVFVPLVAPVFLAGIGFTLAGLVVHARRTGAWRFLVVGVVGLLIAIAGLAVWWSAWGAGFALVDAGRRIPPGLAITTNISGLAAVAGFVTLAVVAIVVLFRARPRGAARGR